MKFLRVYLPLLFGALCVLAFAACSNVEAHVANATLGTTVRAGRIVNPATTFAVTDRMIHLVVDVTNAIANTSVGAKWYSVGAPDRLLFESDIPLDAFTTSADFTLTSVNDWIPGNYRVMVYLNGKAERTLDFVVK